MKTSKTLRKYSFLSSNIWQGIYERYENVGAKGEGFNNVNWVNLSKYSTETVISKSKEYKIIQLGVTEEHTLLPLLVSMLSENKNNIKILDFGGGCGSEFINLLNSLPTLKQISHYIVESSLISKVGAELFIDDSNIIFFESIPKNLDEIDIVYMDSALQYINEFDRILDLLCLYVVRLFSICKIVCRGHTHLCNSSSERQGIDYPLLVY